MIEKSSPRPERQDRLVPLPAAAVMPLAILRDEVIRMQLVHRLRYSKVLTTTSSVLTDRGGED